MVIDKANEINNILKDLVHYFVDGTQEITSHAWIIGCLIF